MKAEDSTVQHITTPDNILKQSISYFMVTITLNLSPSPSPPTRRGWSLTSPSTRAAAAMCAARR